MWKFTTKSYRTSSLILGPKKRNCRRASRLILGPEKEGGPAEEPVRLYWRQGGGQGRTTAHFGSRHGKCCHFLVFGQTTACQAILSPFNKGVGESTKLNPTLNPFKVCNLGGRAGVAAHAPTPTTQWTRLDRFLPNR